MSKTILIVVAHSDDESISMAGTIRKHVKSADKVFVVSMTNGVGARENTNVQDIEQRRKASQSASQILGFEWAFCFDFQDNAMDSHPLLTVVQAVEKVKNIYNPSLVYTHSGADLNIDHRVTANAVLIAFRPQPNEACREIRLFETASATDYGNTAITGSFSPNLFVDITEEWTEKARALRAYSAEIHEYPHSRSLEGIKNLAKQRGNQVGCELAEAFEVIRKIEK